MILVPVKNLDGAKQRLASVLEQPRRTELARAMLEDVLDAIAQCPARPRVSLVTSDPLAQELAIIKRFFLSRPPCEGEGGHEDRVDGHSVFEDHGKAAESWNLHVGPLPAEANPAFVAGLRVELVPFQIYLPNDLATCRHLDRSSQSLAICPNMLERH